MLRQRALSESTLWIRRERLTNREIQRTRERLIRRYRPNPAPRKSSNDVPSKGFLCSISHQQKLILLSVAVLDFTSFCAMSIMAPFFPVEASQKGMSVSVSGFVFGCYALVMFVSSPFMGKILPCVGTKFMLLASVFVAGVCNILFGVLDRAASGLTFAALCFTVRIVEALGASGFSTACYTLIAEIFSDNIGSAVGILETFVGLGMSVGPALGGALYTLGGFGLPFYALGGAMLVTIPLNMWLLPADTSLSSNDTPRKSLSILQLLRIPPVLVVCTVVVVASNLWGFLDPTLEPHLRQFDLTPDQLGLFFLLFAGIYAIFSPIWGLVSDRLIEAWPMMVIGLLASSVSLLIMGPSPIFLGMLPNTVWMNIIALVLLGMSIALVLLPTFEALLDYAVFSGCDDDISTNSMVAGLWSCMYSLGEVIGPSAGGLLLDYCDFPIGASVMAAISATLAVAITIFFCIRGPVQPASSFTDSGISDDSIRTSSLSISSPFDMSSSYDERTSLLSSVKHTSWYATTEKGIMMSLSGACEV